MKRLILLVMLLMVAVPAFAAQPLRVYVAEFSVAGVQQGKDELKAGLQALLAAKMNNDRLTSVDKQQDAEVVVKGTYVVIGKQYSLDVVAKAANGVVLSRSSQMGEGQENLIPAVGGLSDKVVAEVLKKDAAGAITRFAIVAPVVVTAAQPAPVKQNSEIIRPGDTGQVRRVPEGNIVRAQRADKVNSTGWSSKRLSGVTNLLAVGRTLPSGEREVFLAEDRKVTFYRQGAELKPVVSFEVGQNEKIVGLETIDSDNNGEIELYVTVSKGENLASRMFETKGDRLVKIADDLPYFFRALAIAGGPKKLFVQGMSKNADFYGDVQEAVKSGNGIKLLKKLELPAKANIMSFNQFKDADGKLLTVIINPDGYLGVYDGTKELWVSNDKFGESELYFLREEDPANWRFTGNTERFIFLTQRLQVTAANEVLVGKNDGFWVVGNSRSYKKGAVYSMTWNGTGLEEVWRTKDTQNYMPDFYFDEAKGELLLLQLVQRPAPVVGGGTSVLLMKKVD